MLFDRGTFLGEYASAPEWGSTSEGFRVRVLEVLNLIATIPATQRTSPAIGQLLLSIHSRAIRKDVRRPSRFVLMDEAPMNRARNEVAWCPGFDKIDASSAGLGDGGKQEVAVPVVGAAEIERRTHRSRSAGRVGVQKIARSVEPPILRAFPRLANLTHKDLVLLASETRLYTALAGTELLKRGAMDKGAFYLLHGKLKLEAADGRMQFIEAGTTAAQQPVAHLKPRMYTVTAETAVTFLWIPDMLLKTVFSRYPVPGEIQVHLGYGRCSSFPVLMV